MLLLAGRVATAGDKVDTVSLKNGDRITCEITLLDRSLLTIGTDPLGKVSVHWGEVASLASPRYFDVQTTSGAHYFGSLKPAAADQLLVALLDGSTRTLALPDVIRLAPIGAGIWSRVDGSIDAGFSFAQANLETHWTLNGAAKYRSPRYLFSANVSSQISESESEDSILRNSVGFSGTRSLDNRWYTIGWGQFQQNEELSLDLRIVGGGGAGRDLIHTSRQLWSAYGGLAYTNEQFSGEPRDQSVEAVLGGQLEFFTPSHTNFRITNAIVSYFNVSGRSRARLELQSSWNQEFLSDFYWSLNLFDSFDGDPPEDQKNNDFGVSLTLGWKF